MSKKWLFLTVILVVLIGAGWFLKGKLLGKNKDIVVPMTEKARGIDGMAAYLAHMQTLTDIPANPYSNRANLDHLLKRGEPENAADKAVWLAFVARGYMNVGEHEKSFPYYERFLELVRNQPDLTEDSRLSPKFVDYINSLYAIAHMRYGEVANCLKNHTDESCIFPIRGKGIHNEPFGAEKAKEILLDLLNRHPNAGSENIWVLNVVSMALGQYPDSIPEQWLIPPYMFENDKEIPRYNDVAHQAGVAFNSLSGGVCFEDFDLDGYPDIITSGWQLYERIAYFHNNGDGTFSDWSKKSGLGKLPGGLNMLHGDYNNDGLSDVLVLRGGWFMGMGCLPNSLLRNNGDGTFEDVTYDAGLLGLHPTQNARMEDFNNDGWLDIFIGNESSKSSKHHPCELYISNGDGTFTDRADEAGVDLEVYAKGSASADYDNDGDVDLFISDNEGSNILLKNMLTETDELTFEDVTESADISGPYGSFPCWFFDYNNDGLEDIFVASFHRNLKGFADYFLGNKQAVEYPALYRNNGDGTFTDVVAEAGLQYPLIAMGSNYGDINNDGWLDMYLGTGFPDYRALIPNMVYENNGNGGFYDVTTAGGFGHLQKGHGVAFADVDMDGDQDIYAVMGGALQGDFFWNVLYDNPTSATNYLSIALKGDETNSKGVGAKAVITVTNSAGKVRSIYRKMTTGGSFGSSELRIHAGLGSDVVRVDLKIIWPVSGTTQEWTNVPFNSRILVEENAKEYTVTEILPTFTYPSMEGHHHM